MHFNPKLIQNVLALLEMWGWEIGLRKLKAKINTTEGEERAEIQYFVGWISGERGAHKEALVQFQAVEQLPKLAAWALVGQAFVAYRQEQLQSAHKLLDEAHARASAPSDILFATIAHCRGAIYYKESKIQRARAELLKAHGLFGVNHFGTGRVLDSLGSIYLARDDFHAALEFYQQSLKCKKGYDEQIPEDKAGIALSHGQLGRLYLSWGNLCKAEEHFQEDLKISMDIEDQRGEAQMYNYLGQVAAAQGKWEDAAGLLDHSIQSSQRGGWTIMEAFARKDRALVYLSRGVLTEAEDEIRRAHEIFQSCSDGDCHLEGLAHVNRVLGMLYRMQAQSDECAAKLSPPTANFDVLEKYQESEHLLRTALISFDRQGERAEAARTQLEIARTRARSKPRRLITDALLNALERAETCRRDLLVQEIEEELRQVDEVEYYRHIHLRARGRNASAETWSLSTGTREPMTVMFLDVQGSTEFASNHDPEVVMMLLNQMMAEFAAVMETHQATITAYLGDGFMALFRGTDHARHGVTAALELLIALKEFNQPRKVLGLKSINVRIGLSSGEVFIGNVGTYHKMDYTAIGTTANLAARLQSAAKPSLPCISRETYEQVRQRFIFQSDQPRIVKAKGLENQEAWDVVGEKEEPQ